MSTYFDYRMDELLTAICVEKNEMVRARWDNDTERLWQALTKLKGLSGTAMRLLKSEE